MIYHFANVIKAMNERTHMKLIFETDCKIFLRNLKDGGIFFAGFGDILKLVPLAESVIKLNAVCMQCFRKASFTKRTTEETEVRYYTRLYGAASPLP